MQFHSFIKMLSFIKLTFNNKQSKRKLNKEQNHMFRVKELESATRLDISFEREKSESGFKQTMFGVFLIRTHTHTR
jgi:hypothetical protein